MRLPTCRESAFICDMRIRLLRRNNQNYTFFKVSLLFFITLDLETWYDILVFIYINKMNQRNVKYAHNFSTTAPTQVILYVRHKQDNICITDDLK